MFATIAGKLGLDKISLYFIVGMLALISVIVIPNINQISEKLGFDTVASLSREKVVLEANVETLKEVIVDNKDTSDKVLGITIAAKDAVSDSILKKVELSYKQEKAKAKVEKKVSEVGVANTPEKIAEISAARIDFIWESYCNVSSTPCSTNL